jgi:DtxR family Mn-dependent transcriptional regulator
MIYHKKPKETGDAKNLTSNMEDYIEAISEISKQHKVVRVKDIASRLKIKMPSVTAALQKLSDKGLINYEKYGYIELTGAGEKIANEVCQKHSSLAEFFHSVLCLSMEKSDAIACKIEHHLSPDDCNKLKKLALFHDSEKKAMKPWTSELNRIINEKNLSDLQAGESAKIVKISANGLLKKRLIDLGFTRGEIIKVIRYAPLHDPMQLLIKGYNISLRISEAKTIVVEPLEKESNDKL